METQVNETEYEYRTLASLDAGDTGLSVSLTLARWYSLNNTVRSLSFSSELGVQVGGYRYWYSRLGSPYVTRRTIEIWEAPAIPDIYVWNERRAIRLWDYAGVCSDSEWSTSNVPGIIIKKLYYRLWDLGIPLAYDWTPSWLPISWWQPRKT